MSQEFISPLEEVLRQIAAAAPQPWYPRAFAKEHGAELDRLASLLEHLWLEGLIRNTPAVEGLGAGVVLNSEGERLLQDPDALRRLGEGRPLAEGDRGGTVRQALRGYRAPVVTRLLVALNVLVFAYGAYLAWGRGALGNYLSGFTLGPRGLVGLPGLDKILHQAGSVSGADVLAGQWWRLLASAFVHLGLLHLGMTMFILWRAGPLIEQMWGRLRFLLIYLLSVWTGSCLGVAYARQVVDTFYGASGALCGLVAAYAVWLVLNRRYVPRSVLARARRGLLTNAVLLVVFSLLGGFNGWGDGGGALGGALAAVLLNFQRFGPPRWRWLALPALAALPALGVYAIQHQRAANPKWLAPGQADRLNPEQAAEKEDLDFEGVYDRPARQTYREAETFYREKAQRLLEMNYKRRPPAEVEQVLPAIAEQRRKLAPLREKLTRAGPYRSEAVERERQRRLGAVKALDEELGQGGQTLREEAEQADFETQTLPRVRQATKGAAEAFGRVEPLLEQRPARRPAAAVEKGLRELAESRRALEALAEHLTKAGPSRVELVETARKKGLEYAQASAALLTHAERCLRAGGGWTRQDEEALQRQVQAVDKVRGEWNGLVE
jgi:membrane associated rhomboid family serine protease